MGRKTIETSPRIQPPNADRPEPTMTADLSELTQVLPSHPLLTGYQWARVSHPHRVALVDATSGITTTYAQLSVRVDAIARALYQHLRTEPNTNPDGDLLVALCLQPSTDLVAAILAVLQVGAAYVALDTGFPVSRIEHILDDCRPLLLLTQDGAPKPQGVSCTVLMWEELEKQASNLTWRFGPTPCLTTAGDDTVAVVLYTSGSTGVPKGVRIPHRALKNRLVWQWDRYPYVEGEICCFKTALTFVDSLSEIFGPLLTGHTLVVVPKSIVGRTELLVDVLTRYNVGRLVLVPTLLRALLLHCTTLPLQQRLPKLRLWVCSGEHFPADLLESFFQVFTDGQSICNFYGSTEVLGDITHVQFKDKQDVLHKVHAGNVPIGEVISNNHVYLETAKTNCNSASNGNVTSFSEDSNSASTVNGCNGKLNAPPGEMCVYGDSLALGYVRVGYADRFVKIALEEGAAPSLVYRTGDFARLLPSGLLQFEGRKDGQIKVRGHRVDCAEVEAAVRESEGVKGSVVLCYKPASLQQALVAFYTSSANTSEEDIDRQLRDKLSSYMLPRLYRVTTMPLLVNGKVDRQKLLAEYETSCQGNNVKLVLEGLKDSKEEGVARDVLGVVQQVIGTPVRVLLDQDFFGVGGNSLNAVMAVTSLRDLGYNIGLSDFLESASNLRGLVRRLYDNTANSGPATCAATYTYKLIEMEMEDEVIDLVSTCFANKSNMDVATGVSKQQFEALLRDVWKHIVLKKLSFVIVNDFGEIISCSLNFDFHDEPPLKFEPPMHYTFEFLESVEEKVRSQLPQRVGDVVHSFMMATRIDLSSKVNVELIKTMEDHNIRLAKERKYKAIFTTNTSTATRLVCDDLLGYTTLSETPIATHVASDGTTPFATVPSSHMAACTVVYV